MSLEDIFTKIVQINTNEVCFVLCDRGLMDGSAYLSPEQWEVLLNELGLYEQDIKDYRYDLVIHLTTAADGAEAFYHVDNNKARSEDVTAAVELDKKVRQAWANHPNYYLITNDVKDFDSKMRQARDYILKQHGYPVNSVFSVKYILSEEGNIFDRIVNRYKLDVFTITDTFIPNDQPEKQGKDNAVYLRKREHNSRLTFLKGSKYYDNNESYSSTKRNILWKEYVSYIDMYKKNSTSIVRKRCMALIADIYLTFELFEKNDQKFIIVICQGSETFQNMTKAEQLNYINQHLPSYITNNIIADVSGSFL